MSDKFFDTSDRSPEVNWPVGNQAKPSQDESDQWLRKISLELFEPSSGSGGLDLSQMKITFQVRKNTLQSPNMLRVRVYNLSPQTQKKAIEFRKVSLSAGYRTGRYGTIFIGTVVQHKTGKESAVDSYLDIIGGDGDTALGYDTITKTWAAGTEHDTIIKDQIKALEGLNQELSPGTVNTGAYGKEKTLRAYSSWGMIRDRLRDHANASNSDFYIDDGKVNLLARTKYKPGEATVLSPSTGLVGQPEVTPQGIQARCLLNPNLVLGGLVKIETSRLSGVPFMPGSSTPLTQEQAGGGVQFPIETFGQPLSSAFTSPTGTYKILMLEHSGDSRGNPWYSDMVCVALDASGNTIHSVDLPYNRAPGNVWGSGPG